MKRYLNKQKVFKLLFSQEFAKMVHWLTLKDIQPLRLTIMLGGKNTGVQEDENNYGPVKGL